MTLGFGSPTSIYHQLPSAMSRPGEATGPLRPRALTGQTPLKTRKVATEAWRRLEHLLGMEKAKAHQGTATIRAPHAMVMIMIIVAVVAVVLADGPEGKPSWSDVIVLSVLILGLMNGYMTSGPDLGRGLLLLDRFLTNHHDSSYSTAGGHSSLSPASEGYQSSKYAARPHRWAQQPEQQGRFLDVPSTHGGRAYTNSRYES